MSNALFDTLSSIMSINSKKARTSRPNGATGSAAPVSVGQSTTTPPEPVAGRQGTGIENDWFRAPKPGLYIYGISRSYLFQMSRAGILRSMAILVPGKKRGLRLFHRPSLLAFLALQDAQQNGGRQ